MEHHTYKNLDRKANGNLLAANFFFLHFTLFRPINVHTRQIRPCQ